MSQIDTWKWTDLIFCECGYQGPFGQHQLDLDKGLVATNVEHAVQLQ